MITPVDRFLLRAQQAALSHDQRLDTLTLDPIRRGVPSFPLVDSITSARATLTMTGVSTLTVGIHDPDWLIEQSGLLDLGEDGRLAAVRVSVDALQFRLVKASRQDPDTLGLTFEDEAVALLREHNARLTASRGSVTRAQFIERMVREVKARRIPFFSPERFDRQQVALPDYPDAKPQRDTTGFDDGTRLNLTQWDGSKHILDADQMRNAATGLTVADQEGADSRATLALLEACIVEAPMFSNPDGGDATSVGILQLLDSHLGGSRSKNGGRRDVALVSRLFLTKGFTGRGGAIKLAAEHPTWTAGQIAQAVQGSAFPDRYDKVLSSARKVRSAWNSGSGLSSDDQEVLRARSFQFTRGQDGKREESWEAATRLAEDVRWRLFAMGGWIWFVSDDWLISRPAALTLRPSDRDWLIEPPEYDYDHGKPIEQVTFRPVAGRWAVLPSFVVAFQDAGPVNGGWIVETVDINLLDVTDTTVTCVQALKAKKEPAPEIASTSVGTGTSSGLAGAQRAVKWARSKLGHYKEEFGSNRGQELDALERGFGLKGAPWCAIFATTAVVQGGVVDDCRTAAVADIRKWAEAGTHGYLRGFRATPKPGDLMCFGDDHVALVEKVNGDSVTTIEGNTSAGQVAKLTRLKSTGVFVRPDYPN